MPVGHDLGGERGGPAIEEGLGAPVDRAPWPTGAVGGNGGPVGGLAEAEDTLTIQPLPRSPHAREHRPHEVPRRPEVQLQDVPDRAVAPVHERLVAPGGGVVHEDVDRPELTLDPVDELADVEWTRHRGRRRRRAPARPRPAGPRPPARACRAARCPGSGASRWRPPPPRRPPGGDGLPDPPTGAGDQRDLPCQFVPHRVILPQPRRPARWPEWHATMTAMIAAFSITPLGVGDSVSRLGGRRRPPRPRERPPQRDQRHVHQRRGRLGRGDGPAQGLCRPRGRGRPRGSASW